MVSEYLDVLLKREDLVCQKDISMQRIHLSTNGGGVVDIYRDGCTIVSLYNMLRLCDYPKSFDNFIKDIALYKCLGDDGVNWPIFNELQSKLKFVWMQDAELSKCDRVDICKLTDWVSAGANALVKLQSFYGKDRRHFMMMLGMDRDIVTCLESSDISGVPKLRNIKSNEILGVRYFTIV